MLTTKQNFIETVRGGKPDRFVNQYEYMELVVDPVIFGSSGSCDVGQERVNDWGVHLIFPPGNPGPFPNDTGDLKVCKDICEWRDVVKAPDPRSYTDEQWKPTLDMVANIDRNEKFVAPFFMNGMFEKMHYLMGMEDCMCNFYDEPEEMHALLDYIVDWEIECAKVITEKYHPDALFHHDDWGSQISTFLAPDMFEEFFVPAYKKVYGFWKNECGIQFVIHHSDSYAATLVPYMIEMGIDVWQGGVEENDIPALIKKYGGQISFQCGLDNGKYDKADWSRDAIKNRLDTLFKTAGTKYLIPSFTMGGPGSTFDGPYDAATELIDEFSKEYFGTEVKAEREKLGAYQHDRHLE